MTKFFLFYLLWQLTGNPLLAIVLLLILYYIIDRRYVGLFPSVLQPIRHRMRMSNLRRQLALNAHDMPVQYDLAQALIQSKHHTQALAHLQQLPPAMQAWPDVMYDTGRCELALGSFESGEHRILQALQENTDLRHGEPYLTLATAFASTDPRKALDYLASFQKLNLSSCASSYLSGQLLQRLGQADAAKQAYKQCQQTYRTLPKFRRRHERRWALLASIRLLF